MVQQGQAPPALSPNGLAMFEQGVGLLLGRWTALQLAVHNEWGGPSSHLKAQQLQTDIVAWITRSKVTRYIDELEDMMDENMIVLFNTETEDGSLEEVAEKIMSIYEECLDDNYDTIRALTSSIATVSHSASVSQQCENVEDENLERPTSIVGTKDADDMDVDSNQPESESLARAEDDGKRTELSTLEEEADGWQLVSSKSKRKPRRT